MINVGLCVPTWSGWIRHELHQALMEVFFWVSSVGSDAWEFRGMAYRAHAPIEQAREDFCSFLRSGRNRGQLDLVVMIDSDQSVSTAEGDTVNPGAWLDLIVRQYLSGHPRRVLFAPTPMGYQTEDGSAELAASRFVRRADGVSLNYQRDEDGRILRAGSGVMAIPDPAWARLRSRWDRPWVNDAREAYRGEDVLLSDRLRELEIPLEPLRGLTVYHWPEWREPLVHTER